MATNIEQRWANADLDNDLAMAQSTTTTPTTGGLADRVFAAADTRASKIQQLQQAKEQKVKDLSGYEDVTIVGYEDADTPILSDGRKIRVSDPIARYDANEIGHPEQEDGIWNRTKNALGLGDVSKSGYAAETQKRATARILGKEPAAVTDQDIVDVGNMQQLQAVLDSTQKAGEARVEAPVVPGAGQYDFTKGLNIKAKLKSSGTDAYGRTLGSFVNPETGIDVTRQAAQDPRLNAFAHENVNYGWGRDEKGRRVDSLDWDGRLAESVDLMQSEATKYWGNMADAARSASRALAGELGVSAENVDKYLPKNPKLLGIDLTVEEARKDQAKTDKSVGYSTREAWTKEQENYKDIIGKGEYVDAAWNVTKNLDRYLATSAPEMAAMMVPYAGIPSIVATRLNNQMEEFEKTNGRKMTTMEALETAASILPLVYAEKILVKTGASAALDTGKTVLGRTAGVALSGAGETVQEGGEAVQEQWAQGDVNKRYDLNALGEYATNDQTIGGMIAGGVMGSALRGTGEAVGAVKDKLVETDLSSITDKFSRSKTSDVKVEKEPEYELTDTETEELFTQADTVFAKHDMKNGDVKERIKSLRDLEEKAYRIKDGNENKELLLEAIKGVKSDISKEIEGLDDVQEYSKLLGSKESFLDTLDDVMEVNDYKVSGKLEDNLKAIALTFGITDDAFAKIKKDYETVDVEAAKSSRGYLTQGKALRNILDAVEPDKEKVEKLVGQMKRYQASQEKWLKVYDQTKAELEAEVAAYNGSVKKGLSTLAVKPKAKPVKVSKNSEITINVEELADGTFKVNEGGYKNVYDAKIRNIEGIKNEFNKSKAFFKKAGIEQEITGVQTAPVVDTEVGSGKLKKAIEQVKKDFEKNGVTAIISTSNEDGRNKHVVSGNDQILNKGSYNKNDVVSILVPHVTTQEEFDKFLKEARNKNSKLRKEIEAAKEAGATLVIDKGLAKYKSKPAKKFEYVDAKGKSTKKSVREVLVSQLTAFGSKYESEFGSRVFKSREDMKVVKEANAEKAKKADEKQEVLDVIYKEYARTGKVDYIGKITEYFKEKEKLENYLSNRAEKEVAEFVDLAKTSSRENRQRVNLVNRAKTMTDMDEVAKITDRVASLEKSIKAKVSRMRELEAVRGLAEDKLKDANKKHDDSKKILQRYNEAKKSDEITGENTAEEIMSEASEGIVKEVLDSSYTKGAKDEVYKGLTYTLDLNKIINVNNSVLDMVEVEDMFEDLETEAGKEISSNEYIAKAKEFIEKTVTKYAKNGKPDDTITMKASPAYGLIFNKHGEVNESVVMAMKLAMDEYISYKGSTLSPVYKSKEDTAQMLGVMESQLGKNQHQLLKDKGMFKKTVDNEVGKAVMKKLGMSKKKGVEDEVFNRIAAEIGQVAGLIAENAGIVEYVEVSTREYQEAINKDGGEAVNANGNANIKFMRFTKTKGKPNNELIDDIKDKYEAIHKVLGEEESFRKEPKRRPIAKEKRRHVTEQVAKDVTGAKIPTGNNIGVSNEEALNNLIDTKYEYDVGLINELKKMDRDTLLKILGYKTEEDIDKMSYEDRESQVANNRDIVKNLDELLKLNSESVADNIMYFDWFFSSNGRYMMDSNTVNPQTEKQLHRWIVTPAKHRKTYEVKDGKFISDGKDVTDMVNYAIAQSMGFAVDKKSTAKINAFAKELFGMSRSELDKMREAMLGGDKHYKVGEFEVEIEHLGHFMQGLDFLKQAKSGEIDSKLSAEFDAVTSGFGLKLLQLPILRGMDKDRLKGIINGEGKLGTVWYWLNKVGVFKPAQMGSYSSMNDVLDSKGFYTEGMNFYDSYQSLAVDAKIDSDKLDPDSSIYKTKVLNVVAVYRGVESALPELDAGGVVSKALRNLFKDPFMTFNYSAGIKSIRASLSNKLVSDLVAGIVSEKEEFNEATEFLAKLTKNNKKTLILRLREEPLRDIVAGKNSLEDVLLKTMDTAYGSKVQEIMEKNFKPFMDTHKEINAAFKAMFEVFNIRYKAELAKVPAGELTSEKKLEIIEKLRESFPAIKGPMSAKLDEGIHLYKTGSVTPSVEEQRQEPAKTYLKGREHASMIARHIIREFEAAISAGSVVPIHYIDGAVMGQLLGKGAAITAIHDAIIPPLTEAKETIKKYNESMIKVAKEYSVIGAINEMLSRVTLTEEEVKELDKTKIKVGVKGDDGKTTYVSVGVGTHFNNTKKKFAVIDKNVQEARKELFEDIDEGVVVGHMAGVPGSMWTNKTDTKEESKVENGTISRLDRLQKEIGALVPMSEKSEKALEELTEEQFKKLVNDMKDCI